MNVVIYTDGSCHTQICFGAWAVIIFIDERKFVISGVEKDTTHNRMELLAVIRSIDHIKQSGFSPDRILVNSDSQYVVNLPLRMDKLLENNFVTKSGKPLNNSDLISVFAKQIAIHDIRFIKIKAHHADTDIHNREVDMMVRGLVRKNTRDHGEQ